MKKTTIVFTTLCVAGALVACGDGGGDDVLQCVELSGADACAGVNETSLGTGTWYTDSLGSVSCTEVLYVRAGATGGTGTEAAPFGDLPEAAAVAGPGACIALAAGTYTGAALPPSVSLLGRGSAQTTVTGSGAPAVSVAGGSQVLIRGLHLTGDGAGLVIIQAQDLTVESVLVDDTRGKGIAVEDATGIALLQVRIAAVLPVTQAADDVGVGLLVKRSADIQVRQSLIEDCQGSGLIHYGKAFSVEQSVVRNNTEYGIAAACADASCVPAPAITISDSLVEGNQGVGIWLNQVTADIHGTTVRGTVRDRFGLSRSLEGVELPNIQLMNSTVEGGEDLGVFLHASNGVLDNNVISGHGGRGTWIQNEPGAADVIVNITATQVLNNYQVGIGVLGSCDVTVSGGEISGTILDTVPTDTGNVEQGDGMQALEASTVTVDNMLFQLNERKAILADSVNFLTIVSSQFDSASGEPIAVQNIGVDDINQATNLDYSGNQNLQGSSVDPMMPVDPYDCDASQVDRATANLFAN
ncbi:MAG: right-handed parallel beta-helix repeat-containing protein [bacterium]